MERFVETLYWYDYIQYIHYDEKTKKYTFDSELPERARKSFEMWLIENGEDKRPDEKRG